MIKTLDMANQLVTDLTDMPPFGAEQLGVACQRTLMEAGLPIIKPERAARTVKVGALTSSAACQCTPYSMHSFSLTCGVVFTGCRPSLVAPNARVPGCRARQRHARASKTMMALWKTTQV